MKILKGQLMRLLNQVGAEGNSATGTAAGTQPPGGTANDGGGNAGGGAPGGTTQPSGAAGQQTQQGEKLIPQSEVNRLVGQAREEGRRSAQQRASGQGQEQRSEGQDGKETASVPGVEDIVQRAVQSALQAAGVDPFTQAARAAGYTDTQIALARATYDAAKHPDLSKWLTEWPEQVGMTIKAQGNGTGAPTPTASQGAAPRKVDDMRDEAGLIDVFSLSPEQIAAMGPTKIREEFEKAVARGRELAGAPPLPAALRRK